MSNVEKKINNLINKLDKVKAIILQQKQKEKTSKEKIKAKLAELKSIFSEN